MADGPLLGLRAADHRDGEPPGKRARRLILAAEQLGWLHASVEEWKCPRVGMLKQLGEPCVMIDPGPLAYLWAAFLDLGLAHQTSMGIEAWDWANIHAFAEENLPGREAWEVQALRKMSLAYVRFLGIGSSIFALSPAQLALGDDLKDLIPPHEPGEVVTITLPDGERWG